MAFQTGTKVDPRLMAVDYSPIIRANEIKAQAISNLGGQVGGAIKDYKKNKEDVKVKQGQVDQFIRLGESMADVFSESNPAMAEGLRDLIGDASNPDIPLSQRYSMTQNGLNQFNSLLEAGSQAVASQPKPDTKLLQAQQNNEYFRNAVASNTNTDGSVDWPRVTSSYVDLGGTDSESVSKIAKEQQAINDPSEQSPFITVNTGGVNDTSDFDKVMNEKTAKQSVDWLTGGRVRAESNLKIYNEIYSGLASGEIDTRTLSEMVPFVSEELRTWFNPTGQAAVDNIRRVVFQGLKDALGGQFTEKEAERLTNATYNPALSEQENMNRMKSIGDVLNKTIEAKNKITEFVSKGGRIGDYKGDKPLNVYESSLSSISKKSSNQNSEIPKEVNPEYWEYMTEEQKALWNK